MSIYTEEDRITWGELAPSFQELFKTLQSELAFFDKRLAGEIERAKAEEARIKKKGEEDLEKKIKEIFGIPDGKKGQVLRTNKSGLALYVDDHLFLCQKAVGTDPNYCYAYDFDAGTYKNHLGQTKELPWRSFYYSPKSQKLWWYKFPKDYIEIKKTFSSADEVTSGTGVTGAMEVIDFGNDLYDNHLRYYKVYTNGWCEQGGYYAHQVANFTNPALKIDDTKRYVPLKIPYKDSKYIITLSQQFTYEPNSRGFMNECITTISNEPSRFIACLEDSFDIDYSGYRTEGFIDLAANGYNVD